MTSHPINISNVGLADGNTGYFCKVCGDSVVMWAPDETWLHVKDLPVARMVPESALLELQKTNDQQQNRIVFLRIELGDLHSEVKELRRLSSSQAINLDKYDRNVHNYKKHHRDKRVRLLKQRRAMTRALRKIDEAMDDFSDANTESTLPEYVFTLFNAVDSAINNLEKRYPNWDNSWEEPYEPTEDEEGPFFDVEQRPEGPVEEAGPDDPEGVGEEVHRRAEGSDQNPRNEEEVIPQGWYNYLE